MRADRAEPLGARRYVILSAGPAGAPRARAGTLFGVSLQGTWPLPTPPPPGSRWSATASCARSIGGSRAPARERDRSSSSKGPPGAGKTVLLAAARERAEHAGMRVLQGGGGQLERESRSAWARQLFESLLLRATPAERDALLDGAAAAAAPLIGATAQPASHNAADAGADAAFQALHGLFWLTVTSPPERRCCLPVDDLQWRHAGSLRWLAYLVRRLEGMALVVVAGVHSGDPSTRPALLAEAIAEARVRPRSPRGSRPWHCSCAYALGRRARRGVLRDVPRSQRAAFRSWFARRSPRSPRRASSPTRRRSSASARSARTPSRHSCACGSPVSRRRRGRSRAPPRSSVTAPSSRTRRHSPSSTKAAAAAAASTLGRAGLLRLDAPVSFAHPLERAAITRTIPPLAARDRTRARRLGCCGKTRPRPSRSPPTSSTPRAHRAVRGRDLARRGAPSAGARLRRRRRRLPALRHLGAARPRRPRRHPDPARARGEARRPARRDRPPA